MSASETWCVNLRRAKRRRPDAAGKLALHLKKKGRNPLLVGADVYRPAAIKQLEVVAEKAGAQFFTLGEKGDPVDACVMARGEAQMRNCDVIILDTAGRLHIDEKMMDELRRIEKSAKPNEILFVANAMTGQDAVNSAKQFHDSLKLTGVVLTQMDGDARGGAAISLINVTGCPIKFIGTGEKLDALEAFHPDRLAGQILGMGDIVSLVERAQEVVDQEKALKFQQKAKKASWDLEDFLSQMQEVQTLGAIGDLTKMIPGMSQMMPKDFEFDEKEFSHIEAIIQSMTPLERHKPKILNASRRRRIADGSGRTMQDVNRLLKDFEKSRKMMKTMMKGGKGKKGMRGKMRGRMPMMPPR